MSLCLLYLQVTTTRLPGQRHVAAAAPAEPASADPLPDSASVPNIASTQPRRGAASSRRGRVQRRSNHRAPSSLAPSNRRRQGVRPRSAAAAPTSPVPACAPLEDPPLPGSPQRPSCPSPSRRARSRSSSFSTTDRSTRHTGSGSEDTASSDIESSRSRKRRRDSPHSVRRHRRRSGAPVDFFNFSTLPSTSRQPPPPRGLKLPTVSDAALRALSNRSAVVSVDEVVFPCPPAADGSRGTPRYPPLSPAGYLRGVTAIAAYRSYFFPATAIQWLNYLLWLQGRECSSTSALRDMDVRARTHMARYVHEYQDPASLTEAVGQTLACPAAPASPSLLPPAPRSPAPLSAASTSRPNELCLRYNYRSCQSGGRCWRAHACIRCGGLHPARACITETSRPQPIHRPGPPDQMPPPPSVAAPPRAPWR